MSTNGIIAVIVIVVIIVGGIFLLGRDGTDDADMVGEEESSGLDDVVEGLLGGEEDEGSMEEDAMEEGGEASGTSPAGTGTDTPDTGTTGETPPPSSGESGADSSILAGKQFEVTYTDEDGFVPSEITVSAGDTVTWTNESDRPMWVASAIHPTHSLYPEKTSDDCLGSAFDACEGIAVGDTYSFTFDEVGNWGYHDHLKSSRRGRVIVE